MITARCFARVREDAGPRGLWIMTRESGYRGMFFHGDRHEAQEPRYTVEELDKWSKEGGFLAVVELTPQEAVAELAWWPEGQQQAVNILQRHGAEVTA